MRVLMLGLALLATAVADATPLRTAAEAFVFEAQRTPAVAIAHVTPEGIERVVVGPDSVTTTSMFEIGSVTKVFTGVLLADMVLRGEVTLETTVGEILGDERVLDPAVAAITLHQLANHTSGLSRMPRGPAMLARILAFPSDPYRGLTTDGLFDELAALHSAQVSRRGEQQYSNFGMAVLGRLLERVAGTSYEDLIRQRVLQPLALEGMGFTDALIGTDTLVTAHRSNLQPTRNWHLAAYAPAGGLAGSVTDLERFLLAAMHAEDGSAMALAIDEGLGWAFGERNGQVMVWHNGQTGGFHSFVGFRPADGHGIVVLSNAANNADGFAVSILQGEPVAAPTRSAWVPLGFTVLFTLLGPMLLLAIWRKSPSRLQILDGTLVTVFLLAMTWKLGIWTTIPIAIWYFALGASVVALGMTLPRLRVAPWVPAGKPWSTAGTVVSAALFTVLGAWALVRL